MDRSELFSKADDLFLNEVDAGNISRHLDYLCTFEKLSGTEEAHRFVSYAEEYLEREGIPHRTYSFKAYLSDPVKSTLFVGGESFSSRPRSFSACCPEGVRGPLFFDPSNRERMTELEKAALFKEMRGHIVLSHGFDERYAKSAEAAGALAWIQVWDSGEKEIHEDTVSPVWGTPDLDSRFMRLRIPVIAVNHETGERLIRVLEEKPGTEAFLTCVTDEGVREVRLPVAEIPAEAEDASDDFVLLSDHYDTWYVGAFDNTCANAVTLELARVFMKRRKMLKRSVRIAWWPGHSNGRYMGSAWYADNFYDELKERCAASLNSDLIGGRGSDTVFIRTSGLEGKQFLLDTAAAAVPGARVIFGRIGRGADQSFFGCDIPYHVNPRLEAPPEGRETTAPGGHAWWHTKYDTYDIIDIGVAERDARLLGLICWRFLTEERLPVSLPDFFGGIGSMLDGMGKDPCAENAAREIREAFGRVRAAWEKALSRADRTGDSTDAAEADRINRMAGGTIVRLLQSSGSPYEQDTAFAYGPLHLLGESAKLDRESFPEDLYLFSRTTLVRQRNRFVTELKALERALERSGHEE